LKVVKLDCKYSPDTYFTMHSDFNFPSRLGRENGQYE